MSDLQGPLHPWLTDENAKVVLKWSHLKNWWATSTYMIERIGVNLPNLVQTI
jgi:hypothetical protein